MTQTRNSLRLTMLAPSGVAPFEGGVPLGTHLHVALEFQGKCGSVKCRPRPG